MAGGPALMSLVDAPEGRVSAAQSASERGDCPALGDWPGPAHPASPEQFAQTVYRPVEPVDALGNLRVLVRGQGDPTSLVEPDRFWQGCRTPQGIATMLVTQSRDGVRVRAWGPGAHWIIERAPELLGRGDDWSGLDVSRHPLLREARRRNPGLRLVRTNRVFDALVPAIIEQRVTGKEAFFAYRTLVRRHGEAAPGPIGVVPPGLMAPPSAERWLRIPSWQWHAAMVDPARAKRVVHAARFASSLERTLSLGRGSERLTAALRSLPGVGVWTAAETTQRSHGDEDAPSFGDYHLAHRVGYALTGHRLDDDGLRAVLEPWRGQRQRVVRLVCAAGVREPRRGPRMTVQDHRRH